MVKRHGLSPVNRVSLTFIGIAGFCLLFADVSISTSDPWGELLRLIQGIFSPHLQAVENIGLALVYTLSFALIGVTVGVWFGFVMAMFFHFRFIRIFCAVIRAVHELFWALIFLQLFGLSPLTGLLAIGIPYAGIFAKVFAEILEEADSRPLRVVPPGTSAVSAFLFVRLPDAWRHFRSYTLYRLECGLRSSAVLGFVGLPTLGYYMETSFSQGDYSGVAALLMLFYVLIATLRLWMRRALLPLYLLIAIFVMPWGMGVINLSNIGRFLTSDIIPYPLRTDGLTVEGLGGFADWVWTLLAGQAFPGAIATVQLTMIALVVTGLVTVLAFPLISPLFFRRPGRLSGHLLLVVVRSTPEYLIAFVLLQLWGPSMLPAIVALALHNGAIIGHLTGRFTEELKLRRDHPRGRVNLYFYEVLPRVYRQMLAFLFYRWEIIMRETAILGMLGIATLGFYIDSAFAEIRIDRALFLILLTALLNICVDNISRYVRSRLRLQTRLN